MSKIKGIYSEKSIKKAKRKKEEALRRVQKENREFSIRCNHRDADSGKSKLRRDAAGNYECKICGAKVIADPDVMNSENIRESADLLLSLISTIRHEMDLSSKLDDQLVKTALTVDDLDELFERLAKEADKQKDKESKNKNHKHGNGKGGKKGNGKSHKRLRY